jgi:hypothetical protein
MWQKRLGVQLLVTVTLIICCFSSASAEPLAGAYINRSYLNSQAWTPSIYTPWNSVSHWIQPWRAWQTTVPASQFINGVGINFNVSGIDPYLAAEMLAKHGVKRVRINIGWGNLDYATESTIPQGIIQQLQAAKAWGLRPLIILNDDQAVPCPFERFYPTVAANAPVGSTSVQLESTSSLVVGYSGLSFWSYAYTMNYALITAINASTNTVTLSQPIPVSLSQGQIIESDLFKYIPFDGRYDNGNVPDPYYNATQQQATLNGWNKYVTAIATIAAQVMGTSSGDADMGFDMELWNELTVDPQFLDLRAYYGQAGDLTNFVSVIQSIGVNTVDTLNNNPKQFNGVVLEDGFANENCNSSAYYEPARVGALGKHLYPQFHTYPQDEVGQGDYMLNAQLQLEGYPFPFVPAYTEFMPEYFATILDTPSPIQDLCPFTTLDGYGVPHGENSRVINGKVVPCTVFVSEIGIQPDAEGVTDASTATLVKAKGDSRMLVFYLNKGASQVDLFAAVSFGANSIGDLYGDLDFQLLSQNFIDYAANNSTYPNPDSAYVSPALTLIGNIVSQMETGLDRAISRANTRELTVTRINASNAYTQFAGDGTAAHPAGFDRERFTFLPYQVNAHRFVIPYYVMTANILEPIASPEEFRIGIQGINAKDASITVYDPLNNVAVPVKVHGATADKVDLEVTAVDYPYLLIIQEAD